jgi:hypothetical protein
MRLQRAHQTAPHCLIAVCLRVRDGVRLELQQSINERFALHARIRSVALDVASVCLQACFAGSTADILSVSMCSIDWHWQNLLRKQGDGQAS